MKIKKKIYSSGFQNGALTPLDMKQIKYKILYAIICLFMLTMIAIVVIPALWMVMTCFKEPAELASVKQSFFPKQFRFEKFADTWSRMKLHKYFINTLIMSVGAVVADVIVNGLAGYVLSKLKPRGAKAYFALVTVLLLVNAPMIPLYMTFVKFPIGHFNMLGTYWPIWMMAAANMFNILLFKTSFDSISISLVEAAKVDGASAVRIFMSIIIPMSVPVITTVAIFTFNGNFGAFFWPYLIVPTENRRTIGVMLYMMKSNAVYTLDTKMIAAFICIIPQLLIFIIFQKKIIGGINLGGVKG